MDFSQHKPWDFMGFPWFSTKTFPSKTGDCQHEATNVQATIHLIATKALGDIPPPAM